MHLIKSLMKSMVNRFIQFGTHLYIWMCYYDRVVSYKEEQAVNPWPLVLFLYKEWGSRRLERLLIIIYSLASTQRENGQRRSYFTHIINKSDSKQKRYYLSKFRVRGEEGSKKNRIKIFLKTSFRYAEYKYFIFLS